MKRRIGMVLKQLPIAAARALREEAEIEMAESKERVPVRFGILRASGYVAPPKFDRGRVSVELGYGTSYAVQVHEDLDAFHRVGEAKYLESVLMESAPYMAVRVGRRLNLDQL